MVIVLPTYLQLLGKFMSSSTVNSPMLKNRIIGSSKITSWILAFILFSPAITFAQGVKVKWQDSSGREFSIVAPSGELGYSMLAGDKIAYNFSNQVSRVGDVAISYNFSNQVSRVGDVSINYNFSNQVSQVGGLKIQYNFSNQVTGTSGSVK